jgi:putative transposase
MSRAHSISTESPYGLARVCDVWRVPRSTVYGQRARAASPPAPPRRRGPVGPCTDEELLAAIRQDLEDSPFHGEGHRKVWARLRMLQGLRTSKDRVLRLMREHGLLAPSRVGRPRGPRTHDGTILTDRPDEMWGTDLTSTILTTGATASVFIAIDHCTGECVGIHASARATRFEALEPLRQGVREHFGDFAPGIAMGLSIRHDHGSQYVSDDFQGELRFLGMESSPSFVRAPEGNGVAERFIRTLKENLLWVRHFETVEALRQALLEFKQIHNEHWRLERLGYRTPAQARRDFEARQVRAA